MRAIPKLRPLVDKGDISLRAIAAKLSRRASATSTPSRQPVDGSIRPAPRRRCAKRPPRRSCSPGLPMPPRAIAILLSRRSGHSPRCSAPRLRCPYAAAGSVAGPDISPLPRPAPARLHASVPRALRWTRSAARTLEKQLGTAASPDTDAVFAFGSSRGPRGRAARCSDFSPSRRPAERPPALHSSGSPPLARSSTASDPRSKACSPRRTPRTGRPEHKASLSSASSRFATSSPQKTLPEFAALAARPWSSAAMPARAAPISFATAFLPPSAMPPPS